MSGETNSIAPVIDIHGVTKVYKTGTNEVAALKGIDLTVRQGELVAIMGSSGSGKSTLMNILGCLDVPSEGNYALDGTRVERLSRNQLADIRPKAGLRLSRIQSAGSYNRTRQRGIATALKTRRSSPRTHSSVLVSATGSITSRVSSRADSSSGSRSRERSSRSRDYSSPTSRRATSIAIRQWK